MQLWTIFHQKSPENSFESQPASSDTHFFWLGFFSPLVNYSNSPVEHLFANLEFPFVQFCARGMTRWLRQIKQRKGSWCQFRLRVPPTLPPHILRFFLWNPKSQAALSFSSKGQIQKFVRTEKSQNANLRFHLGEVHYCIRSWTAAVSKIPLER